MRTHLFVACTNRKRIRPDRRLRLGNADDTSEGSSLADYVRSWTTRLDDSNVETLPASQLYKGEQWALVRHLASERRDVRVWICSAGYGLVGFDTRLKAYSATFASGQPDSVRAVIERSSDGERIADWWRTLADWPGPSDMGERHIADVVASEGHARFVIALPQTYLEACGGDLIDASRDATPNNLIVTTSQPVVGGLSEFCVHAPGALRNRLGGTIGSVALRLGVHLVRQNDLNAESARVSARVLTDQAGGLQKYDRKRDPGGLHIEQFISERLRSGDPTSASALLREFRDSGNACEQRRFGEAYRRIKEEVDHE
jgi:hypothetical protein